MKETKKIVDFYHSHAGSGERMALATVVNVEDSSYRRIGARMLILESGHWVGGISGGCLEGDALLNAKKVMMKGEPKVVVYDTRDRDAHSIGVGLGCEGRIEVFLQPLAPQDTVMDMLERCLSLRECRALVTPFSGNGQVGVPYFADALLDNRSRVVEAEGRRLLYEYVEPNIHAIVVGDNYDVYPLLAICREMGWELTLAGRKRKLRKEALDGVGQIVELEDVSGLTADAYTAVLCMSHDYAIDRDVLAAFSDKSVGYLGVLGPRKRFDRMVLELGLSPEAAASVHSPMGLHIGAAAPEEISISIVAEVVRAFRGGDGRSLKDKEGPIHERG
jgi:xanthine dehydrogenase accessory factor